MGISYKPLWKLLVEKDMNKTQLRMITKISTPTIAKMGKNEYVSLEIIDRICNKLNCKIFDVVEHIPEGKEKKEE